MTTLEGWVSNERPPADICEADTGFDYLVRNVSDVAPYLTWHGQRNGVAIWSSGNCLIAVVTRMEHRTELQRVHFRFASADKDANRSWNEVQSKLSGLGIPLKPSRNSSRVAESSLSLLREDDITLQRQSELTNKTAEQAAEEFFARFNQIDGAELESKAKGRKGGPVPLSDDEKLEIVREWEKAQRKETQESFCSRKSIGTSTLRGYIRDLKAKGKL